MLYDNALLVRAYFHAWQVTKDPVYKRIIEETLDFVQREMTHAEGGFFSSLEADSEVEGKFTETGRAKLFPTSKWMMPPSPHAFAPAQPARL